MNNSNKLKNNTFITIITLILFISNYLNAQVSPPNYSKLNYTQVMFEYPEIKNAIIYKIEIAEIKDTINFSKLIVKERYDITTATLINGLKFGTKYFWRYIAYSKDGDILFQSETYYFSILNNILVSKDFVRYNIHKKETNDGLIFFDFDKVAINRDGEPVWFLPYRKMGTIDLKMTKTGTITFLLKRSFKDNKDYKGVEVYINGKTIWETPYLEKTISGDTLEYFHHEFKKLSNGNYMVLGEKYSNPKNEINTDKICFGTIIEYDSKGEIVWTWDSEKYISDKDIYISHNNNNKKTPNIDNKNFHENKGYDFMHTNGFYYDETNNFIYLSSRNLSRVSKIQKKTGKIVESFGDKSPSGEVKYANNYFKYLHSPLLLPNGNIAVFNNNNNKADNINYITNIASVVVFSQPNATNDTSKIEWEFKCDFDSLHNGYSFGKGNINYLNNSDFLVNMGEPISRAFQVTQDKKVVWDCYAEKYSETDNKWIPNCSNRVFYFKSLYPIYFTISNSFNPDTIIYNENKSTKIEFSINNEGSNSDSYNIKYISQGKEFKTYETEEIPPNESIKIKYDFNKIKPDYKRLKIIISSVTNPDYNKEINFFIK